MCLESFFCSLISLNDNVTRYPSKKDATIFLERLFILSSSLVMRGVDVFYSVELRELIWSLNRG